MKKLIALAVAAAALGTAGFAEGSKEKAPAGAQPKVTLTVMHLLDLTDKVTSETWDILVKEFKAKNPGIELEVEFLASESYHTKLQTVAAADRLPDVMYLWPDKRTAYVTDRGLAKDLSPRLKGKESLFVSGALSAQNKAGAIFQIPETMNATHVMFTNEKLLKDLGLAFPKTLDELIAQGPKIRAAGLIPIAMSNKDGWQMQSCFLSALCERAGGMAWYDAAIAGKGAGFADPQFVAALDVVKKLSDAQMFTPGVNQADYGSELSDFVAERAVYMIDGGWRCNNLTTELTADQKSYVSLRTIPDIPGQKGRSGSTASTPGTGFGMKASIAPEKEEAAWKWIWFYSGPEGSKIRQARGAVPAYKLEAAGGRDAMVVKLDEFMNKAPAGYVMDAKLDGAGMGVLQTGLQAMMMGKKSPADVAAEYEAWVAANDSNRKK